MISSSDHLLLKGNSESDESIVLLAAIILKCALHKQHVHSLGYKESLFSISGTPAQFFLEKGSAMRRATFVIFFTEVIYTILVC